METFESFDALFQKAIYYEQIKSEEIPILNSINQTFYEWEFSIWLQKNMAYNPKDAENSIQQFLTEENWFKFSRKHNKEAATANASYLKKQSDRKRKIDN